MVFTMWRQCALPPNTYFFGPIRVQITAECPCTLQWAAPCLKIAPSYGKIWTPIEHMVPWVRPSPQRKQHRSRFSRYYTVH